MLLAIFHVPAEPSALQRVADSAGMHVVDVRRRLAGPMPRVLFADVDQARVRAVAASLAAAGVAVAAVDPADIPGDGQWIVARRLELAPGRLVVIEGVGAETRHELPAGAITLVQRARRREIETETVETTERKLSAGRALASGGLLLHKKVKTTTTRTSESVQSFALVQRSDGGPDVALYEQKLAYRFLGADMQPSSRGNFEQTIARVRALAPAAALDTRASQPGFLNGLAGFGVDPVDLALHLVRLAHMHPGHAARSA